MRKKWLIMGGSLGIAVVLFLASGFTSVANYSGYDAYKSAVKNNRSVMSMTSAGNVAVTDNGTEILSGNFNAKMNHEQNEMSVELEIERDSQEHTLHVYKQDDKMIFKKNNNDIYYVKENLKKKWNHDGDKSGPPKHMESLIDALVGNIKELATVEDAENGGKKASLHLSGSQIPTVLNEAGSLPFHKMANNEHWKGSDDHTSMDTDVNIPKLTENVQVKELNLEAEINAENYLERQMAELVLTGTDEFGKNHELVISFDVNISGFNQTVADSIELKGKQVEKFQENEKRAPWHK